MIVKELIVYPIKGLGGWSVESAFAGDRGFKFDRKYMLIDKDNTFLSQRTVPEMAVIRQEIVEEELILTHKASTIRLNLDKISGHKLEAALFEHTVVGTHVSSEADQFFSEALEAPVRLIKMLPEDIRLKRISSLSKNQEVSFADGYPYLILGTASMDLLNDKLEEPLSYRRFRPNIVVETREPHTEDHWTSFRLGEAVFRNIKPCVRCSVTTVNQRTGDRGVEPLKTLASYRREGKGVIFGSNMIATKEGWIRIGDPYKALENEG